MATVEKPFWKKFEFWFSLLALIISIASYTNSSQESKIELRTKYPTLYATMSCPLTFNGIVSVNTTIENLGEIDVLVSRQVWCEGAECTDLKQDNISLGRTRPSTRQDPLISNFWLVRGKKISVNFNVDTTTLEREANLSFFVTYWCQEKDVPCNILNKDLACRYTHLNGTYYLQQTCFI